MKRREFLRLSVLASAASVLPLALRHPRAAAADAKKLTDKEILKDGQPATIANYCTSPEKQPNKACPGAKDKPGNCEGCMFFNKDNSLTEFKGGKYARCQLLGDATKPQYVSAKGWCATYTPKPA